MSSFNIFGARRKARPTSLGGAPGGALTLDHHQAQHPPHLPNDQAVRAAEAKRRLEIQFHEQQKELLIEQQRQQQELQLEHQRRLAAQQAEFERQLAGQQQQSRAPVQDDLHVDQRKPTRVADLLNNEQEEDDYALPMEDEETDEQNGASLWGGGFEDVSRDNVPHSFGPSRGVGLAGRDFASKGAVQLPPLSSIGTSADFSTPPSMPRSPRSNVAEVFAAMNFERGGTSGPPSSRPSSRPNVAPLPPIRLRMQNEEAGGEKSTTSKDVLNYGPTSKNSRASSGIRKKNPRSTASTTSRAVERAALVSSLPSPKKATATGVSDPFGVYGPASAPNVYGRYGSSTDSSQAADRERLSPLHSSGFPRAGSASTNRHSSQAPARPKGSSPVNQSATPVKKCYVGAKASQFCHVCRRSNNAEFASCRNLADGSCRKVVCDRCFVRHNWSWAEYSKNPQNWECPHCTSQCPPKASCHLYSRINSSRLTKKEREALANTNRSSSAGGVSAPSTAPMNRSQGAAIPEYARSNR
eukprot:CAMPEP_0185844328 /NCGR_PEP_ID=MMETSP1354-20130828/530_1 /TAXON_ID=708628 /ORGANISM="Erythrolobus madagascarensis, Strain CCMP3276" /LENGTH=525 /DNA_ID=CAMNT_0028543971 /DNA_START=119 /DNA_END=1696 /DNA_ORIENTATION=-